MFRVTVKEHFDAAHRLPNYNGPCSNLHGHRWEVEVCYECDTIDPKSGMVIDFKDIKGKLRLVVGRLDHTHLNQKVLNPTAEMLAVYIWDKLDRDYTNVEPVTRVVSLVYVKVWESPDAMVEYRGSKVIYEHVKERYEEAFGQREVDTDPLRAVMDTQKVHDALCDVR